MLRAGADLRQIVAIWMKPTIPPLGIAADRTSGEFFFATGDFSVQRRLFSLWGRTYRWAGSSLAIALTLAGAAFAERPSAPKLLPTHTLAFARITDAPLLRERFKETALGRIAGDEDVKPLVSSTYAAIQEAWNTLEDRISVPLDDLIVLPQGEIAVGFVSARDQPTGVVMLMDVKERLPTAIKLLEDGETFVKQEGGDVETVKIAGVEATLVTGPDGGKIVYFEKEGTLVFTTSEALSEQVLDLWDGSEIKSLAENDQFNSIMSRCAGSSDDPPQFTFFVDPIEIVRATARGNFAVQTAVALFPVLGVDGVKGVGGSLTFSTGEFDQVAHYHILIEEPRAGIVKVLAFGAGDTTPEPWVPAESSAYTTLHWNVQESYSVAAELYNSIMEEGEFQREVKVRLSDRIGVDVEKEIVPALDGRISIANWIQKPATINGQCIMVGLKLKDANSFLDVHNKIVEKFADRLEKKTMAGVTYHVIPGPSPQQPPAEGDTPRPRITRQPTPCFAIVGDYLLICDSVEALEASLLATTDPARGLADQPDFKLIASKVKRQNGGNAPGMLQFSRPEESMRMLYDLATGDAVKSRIDRGLENENPFFKRVDGIMKENPIPPFSSISKYLAPGGGMATSDETGLHYSAFTLKRQLD